ncbi:MAG TPA: exonuclease domain-containing protein [Flavobacteriaceae bacterium]|nr:exonuclease domain-containing protein [Flavobacteriaceae bacterium]
MYAILDIETTGGKYNEEGITEIAIYKFDGHEIVDRFVSLVNPERPIQPFVVGLTGIDSDMLRNAPKFYEVAKRIVEITSDCVLVAHNAKFDYRILRTEFFRLGYEFQRKSLCTVEIAKKLIPDMPSYSLGKLVKSLGIPISKRHRAEGDAVATVQLFKLLLDKDSEKTIIGESLREVPKKQVDNKLLRMLDNLPSITGVYYFHNEKGEVIYIGKSKNIQKRARQHFVSEAHKSRQIQREIHNISYEPTGNELIALLKENEEIKRNRPKYNRALKRNTQLNNEVFTHALYPQKDENGYLRLKIAKADFEKEPITTFTNLQQGKRILQQIADTYDLCQKLTGLHQTDGYCFDYNIKKCSGACMGEEPAESYNKRVETVIEKLKFPSETMLVVGKGRKMSEKSALLIEGGAFKGFGYFDLNHQIERREIMEKIIVPMENNRDAKHIIQNYMRRNQQLKIIQFD